MSENPSEKAWYIVQTHSSCEERVKKLIQERVPQHEKLSESIDAEEVLIPAEEVIKMRRGQNKEVKRKLFPGYVFVKMAMNEHTNHFIRNLPRVTGFLGAEDPTPLSEEEVGRIMNQIQQATDRPRPSVTFVVGEQVRVADGPFASFNGIVEDVDMERSRLKVSVSIFGRATPVDLEYSQVEKS